MLGFLINVAQMIIMTRGFVANKNHVASSKFKVKDHTLTLIIGHNKSLLYPPHNFVLHGGISKLYGKTSVVRKVHVASLKAKIII